MKIYTIIGGVNGCGKSSLTGILKAEHTDLGIVVDPDKLSAELCSDTYAGCKLAVEKLEGALTAGISFTQETTLSGAYAHRLAKRAKEAGYFVRLYYVGLDTLSESVQRIESRVRRGGHNIPLSDVERRFKRRFLDAARILSYCDEAKFFDNDNGFRLVAKYEDGEFLLTDNLAPKWMHELIGTAHAPSSEKL